ncbi:MAG: exodeoxyribonuclease V subunit alpha [Thiohalomonadaceae bacterium]
MLDRLKQTVGSARLRNVDYYFAAQMHQLDAAAGPLLPLAAALLSHAVGSGNTCLDLKRIAKRHVLMREDGAGGIEVPSLEQLNHALASSTVVGAAGELAPLILDEQDRLYLGRYWCYEQQVAEALRARAISLAPAEFDHVQLRKSLRRMFPATPAETDWQLVASAMAVLRQFVLISGGPGTGKTRTVTSILALLIELAADAPLRIALTAPTGKAAARLSESIRLAKPNIACSDLVRQHIPEEASTLHRLLGIRPGRIETKYHAGNPLLLDLVVVDEASMIDLPLMARLLDALPAKSRLILLGDKDQLASVEAGSIFADISGRAAGNNYTAAFIEQLQAITAEELSLTGHGTEFGNSVALLRKSYRFASEKGIGLLAIAINSGDSDSALALLAGACDGVGYQTIAADEIYAYLARHVVGKISRLFVAASPREAIEQFNEFRILCAVRNGPVGVEQINQAIENILRAEGKIKSSAVNYPGRPIMVTRNDYGLGLFNGDTGIMWPDPESGGALRAWFILPDNSMKVVLPSRLPEHETAYAMTVHKSQGSEFDRVIVVLPNEISPILTRELLYTGVTRARYEVDIWASDDIIRQCIKTRVERMSGLTDKIYLL